MECERLIEPHNRSCSGAQFRREFTEDVRDGGSDTNSTVSSYSASDNSE